MPVDEPTPEADAKISLEDLDSAPEHLSDGDQSSPRSDRDTLFERARIVGEENFELKQKVAELERKRRTKDILDGLIEPYASKAFLFMCIYSSVVAGMLISHGATFWYFRLFSLPTSVLEFLVGSTAVTVIGLVGMVLTGVFVGARK